jgi:hypothetical protein
MFRLPVFATSGPHVVPASVDLSILYSVTGDPLTTVGATQSSLICEPGSAVDVRPFGTSGCQNVVEVATGLGTLVPVA